MKILIKFIIREVPRKILIKFSFLFAKVFSVFLIGNKFLCPICGGHFRKFLPYGIGNNYRKNALCPRCLSLERHRLLWLFLKNKTDFFSKNLKILHVAPEQCFYKKFKSLKNINYTTVDLESPLADVKADIQNMPFKNNEFDVIICNHVFEHIENDIKAMTEIYRILNRGGWAIMQVPINKNLENTYENSLITNPMEREKHFGRGDHLRMYGLDYKKRLRSAGFKVEIIKYIKKIDKKLIKKYSLSKNEYIYLGKK